MSKTKVWIIGAKGRLGSTISDALDRMAYNVLTSDMDVDITDMGSVTAFMDMSIRQLSLTAQVIIPMTGWKRIW